MLDIEPGQEPDMIASQPPTPTRPIAAARGIARSRSSPTFLDLLDELACGIYGLETPAEETFRDTIPAICWAVPGAHAGSVEG
jgi:hypothetical protein